MEVPGEVRSQVICRAGEWLPRTERPPKIYGFLAVCHNRCDLFPDVGFRPGGFVCMNKGGGVGGCDH